ncbi:Peptidase family M23 [Neomoorella glycerini]|uniref:Peptidase family M23 n=1 Tax=Neomoorella glycerini TaxID=55779 RepID=A0A6I5ZTJ2_9FIRM|nr:peptidoglycan DD-metalloendopeptidase family protein [Moorella glycerini]QGP93362.1 Peptidase family M23 [Moorella glycerini]
MGPVTATAAIKTAQKAGKLVTSARAREGLAVKIEYLAIGIFFLIPALLISLVLIFFLALGMGDQGKTTGFRSGAPTAFAVADIPAQYLPIFLKAQERYGVSWAILAAIAKIESGFGSDMKTSSAGAIGFMQFMPATWEQYKQDGDGDGRMDPYNPYDAIFAAANMLKANGFATDPRRAIFAYNHANWYVDMVMSQAAAYASTMLPVGQGVWPLLGQYKTITDGYGMRWHPILKKYSFHDGIDLPAPEGTPVFAMQDGRVLWDRENGAYGLCVILDHGGLKTMYGHLADVAVRKGEKVKAGQVIGYIGNTGLSTGPHLHFSVYINGQPANPEEWLKIPSGNN